MPEDIPDYIEPNAIIQQVDKHFPVNSDFAFTVEPIGWGHSVESTRLERSLRNKSWKQVPFELVQELSTYFHAFAVRAYQYYLPAFLVNSFNDSDTVGILGFTVSRLCPPRTWEPEDRINRWYACHEGFKSEQIRVIVTYLEYATWHHYPKDPFDEGFDALTDYWYTARSKS